MSANLILAGVKVVPFLLQAAEPNPASMTREQFNQQIALEAVKHGPAGPLVAVLVPLGVFAMVVAIVWLGMRHKQARLRARAEFHKQLLDKFSSGKEFTEFLESKGSQRFLEELWSQGTQSRAPSFRGGIVLTTLGLGLCGLSWVKVNLLTPGVIILALGVGFLISSSISYHLSKKSDQAKDATPKDAPAS
jgi:hypothetical protein